MRPFIGILLIAVFSTGLAAKERSLEKLSNKELIELLASKNPRPEMEDRERNGEFPHFAKNYDHEKQKIVLDAAKELRDRGVKAFPDLVKAVDDKRYCCLKMGDEKESRHALSVGRMAWFIIHVQVDACLDRKSVV